MIWLLSMSYPTAAFVKCFLSLFKTKTMDEKTKQVYMERVEAALESIRPYLIADGGNIDLVDISDDLVVQVALKGACHGCPMHVQTMKFGVEQAVKSAVPEIKSVVAVN